MKLSYPVATPEVRAAILGFKGSPAEVFPALRDLGYTAIEPFIGDPAGFDQDAWIAAVQRSGLTVAAVGTGPVVFDHKLTFTDANPDVRRAAIERAQAVVRFSAQFGAQVNIGKLRGDLIAGDHARCHDWMRAALTEVCATAADLGVTVTLEPQNRTIINNLNTTAESLACLGALTLPNLRLMLDVFHMHQEREDLIVSLTSARDVLMHMHFADTERRAPGDGTLDFNAIIAQLRSFGYNRCLTVEIRQQPDSLSAARRSATYLLPLLKSA
ncbi:MAG: sugar phosphate isomerase/epimerase [Lacunisphaera sp.]|nr:sugar phosphate isomerase/epimerase [Lacunisphaera sp.]